MIDHWYIFFHTRPLSPVIRNYKQNGDGEHRYMNKYALRTQFPLRTAFSHTTMHRYNSSFNRETIGLPNLIVSTSIFVMYQTTENGAVINRLIGPRPDGCFIDILPMKIEAGRGPIRGFIAAPIWLFVVFLGKWKVIKLGFAFHLLIPILFGINCSWSNGQNEASRDIPMLQPGFFV